MKKILIFAILFVCGLCRAEWILITTTGEENKNLVRVFVNDDLEFKGSNVTFWAKYEYETNQKLNDGKQYKTSINRSIANCSNKTFNTIQALFQDENGESARSWIDEKATFAAPFPDTVGATLIRAVCNVWTKNRAKLNTLPSNSRK